MLPIAPVPIVPSVPIVRPRTGIAPPDAVPAGTVPPLLRLGSDPGDPLVLFPLSVVGVVVALVAVVIISAGVVGAGLPATVGERLPSDAVGEWVRRPFADDTAPEVPAVSALPEEEQFVVELLRRNGGQVRQSTIVEASDWSKSKVSRLLSTMEAEGHVRKISVGRENVIALPGVDLER